MKTVLAALGAIACAFLQTAYAQSPKMRPGLWEHSYTMKSQSGEMEKQMAEMRQQMASMPPEQRKMMENMLAQQGMGMGSTGRSVRMCITREQAERMEVPQQDGNCRQQIVQRGANTVKLTFTCAGNPPTTGESEVTFASDAAYSSKSVVNTQMNGRPERMTMDQKGKWLSADCGNIKPMPR